MNALPDGLEQLVGREFEERDDPALVDAALVELGVCPAEAFREFFRRFRGPCASDQVEYQLQDLVADTWSIKESTLSAREKFQLPTKYLVITNFSAGGVLMLDTESGSVFDVDFEEGLVHFLTGSLKYRWSSFEGFLADFFNLGAVSS